MPLISDADRGRVQEFLAGMTAPVRLEFFTQSFDCETCETATRVLDELVPLDARLSVVEHNRVLDADLAERFGIERAPGLALLRVEPGDEVTDFGVRFYGAPVGYEFTSLLDAILLVSSGDSGLSAESREALASLATPLHLQVFTTPT